MKKATIETSMGTITVELDDERAPATVENFVKYAADGFYDGTIFHRVIDGFMVQGGGFTRDMKPDSATSQFFINLVDNGFLDFTAPTQSGYGYAVFGKVTDGMEVVDRIAKVRTGFSGPHQNVPEEPVVIRKVTVV